MKIVLIIIGVLLLIPITLIIIVSWSMRPKGGPIKEIKDASPPVYDPSKFGYQGEINEQSQGTLFNK